MTLAKSLQSAAGNAAADANYIEDVFSTWLYTGNGSTQTITNNIDLAGEGGLVWCKARSVSKQHCLLTTDIPLPTNPYYPINFLATNSTSALQDIYGGGGTGPWASSYLSNGFSLYNNENYNESGTTYASWTFRKQPKFFDVVTYTGTGFTEPNISHNLGSVPGCIIIKRTNSTGDWFVYHRSIGTSGMLVLNSTAASASNNMIGATPTSTTFKPAGDADISGATYVAYLFAHDAGGFGLTGTDNVISCGSVSGFGTVVDLGFEPQWILMKQSSGTSDWIIADNMRGIATGGNDALLFANTSGAETSANDWIDLTSTGFVNNVGSGTFIYIAIRRGPMKVPTTGTSVFSPNATSNDSVALSTGFPVDLAFGADRSGSSDNFILVDRLRGSPSLRTASTSAETGIAGPKWANNTGFAPTAWGSSANTVWEMFRRAPGFFDVVCYTGTGSATTQAHNLAAVPELMFVKRRQLTNWAVYHSATGPTKYGTLNETTQFATSSDRWNDTTTSSTVFTVGTDQDTNLSGGTYVAYLFASCPGVSKCGSYTGTGTTQQINCGFTGGARFVLIKRTDSTGAWYVWDSARGIVAGNDPYLLLNSTAAEVTSTDYIDPYSAGFEISSTAPAAINASGGSFIFLAIA